MSFSKKVFILSFTSGMQSVRVLLVQTLQVKEQIIFYWEITRSF